MPTDIQTRQDLLHLMEHFYKKLLTDETLRPIFIDVAKINLEEHLPILADFWEGILFQKMKYKRNAMEPHLALHEKHPFKKIHFETWLKYFNESIDELYVGEKAELAKQRAKSIAMIMQFKTEQMG